MQTSKIRLIQNCPEEHQLEFFFVKPKSLEYCDGCLTVMKEQGFRCADDDYCLCEDCVRNNPPDFVGTALNKLRGHLDEGEKESEEEQPWGEDEEYNYDAPFEGYGDDSSSQ